VYRRTQRQVTRAKGYSRTSVWSVSPALTARGFVIRSCIVVCNAIAVRIAAVTGPSVTPQAANALGVTLKNTTTPA
jgi:hypothetical protein